MTIRERDLFYAVTLLAVSILVLLLLAVLPAAAQSLSLIPPPAPGGAMPVTWNDITHPTSLDWVGLYAPETNDHLYIEYIFVNGCSHFANFGWQKSGGTCGFVIPSDVPPGIYELRLYSNGSYDRLSTSPRFQILEAR